VLEIGKPYHVYIKKPTEVTNGPPSCGATHEQSPNIKLQSYTIDSSHSRTITLHIEPPSPCMKWMEIAYTEEYPLDPTFCGWARQEFVNSNIEGVRGLLKGIVDNYYLVEYLDKLRPALAFVWINLTHTKLTKIEVE
jgi:hypothetical protein